MKLTRRSLLATGAAALASPGAAAMQDARATLDFEGAGGSTRNSGARNRQAFVAAVMRLHLGGGGTLKVRPGTYAFSGEAAFIASNVRVVAPGAVFQGPRCRITIGIGSHRISIEGLTLVETSGGTSTFLLNCGGSACTFRNVHLEKRPSAGGYIAYCQQNTAGNLFENVSFAGSNGVFMGGRDHRVIGGHATSSGSDDCWVLKSTTHPCSNIRISGFRAEGFAALMSIGSEIGRNAAVKASGPLFVRNVLVENCAADRCTYLAYIKPGGVEGGPAYDYRNGLVEDVTITDCRCEDVRGAKFRNAVYVSPGRGATVRRLAIRNLTVKARGAAPAVQNVGAIYIQTLHMAESDPGSTVEFVSIEGLRCTDPFGGAPTGPSRPGVPIQISIAIEKQRQALGRVGAIHIANAVVEGCSRSALLVGPGIAGPVTVQDSSFRDFAAGVLGASDRRPILAMSPVAVRKVTALPSPLAPPGTTGLSVGAVETVL